MSDEDFFRKLREDIKNSTEQMLRHCDPPIDPKPLAPNTRLATDPSEVDPGFEFVKQDHSKTQSVNSKKENSNKRLGKNEPLKLGEDLKKDALTKIESIKSKLKVKQKQCEELYGKHNNKVAKENALGLKAEANSESVKSNASVETKTKPKPEELASKAKDIDNNMKEQHKINDVSIIAEKSSISSNVSKRKQKKNEGAAPLVNTQKSQEKNEQDTPKNQKLANKVSKPEPACLTKPENILLLTLLSLNSKQRGHYLVKIGKERGFLIVNKADDSVQLNPKFAKVAALLKRDVLSHADPTYKKQRVAKKQLVAKKQEDVKNPRRAEEKTPLEIPKPKVEKFKGDKKVTKTRIFEDEVSYFLNNGETTPKKDYKKELTLENVSNMERNGFLSEPNKAALAKLVDRLVEEGVGYIVEGAIRINQKNNHQAFVDDCNQEGNIFISSILLRKCAMEGDIVKVFVKHANPEAEQSKQSTNTEESNEPAENGNQVPNNKGFVIEILEKRHNRRCVGRFKLPKENNTQNVKFVPRDTRIPSIMVYKQCLPDALLTSSKQEVESVLYQAEIIDWHNDIPIATIHKSIGNSDELESEKQAILTEYDLDVTPYSEEILNSLPIPAFQIPAEEIAKREDLRKECIFTIDPLTAKDLDDALSCKLLKNGNYEIGVHISDVSYFLREGSELDELVKLKATSIYMVDGVYHMLPKPLCFLCSLLPGEDKLAFSVFWEITPNAKVLSTRFAKTVINSCAQLAYEHAQVMLDNPNKDLQEADFPTILNGYTPNYLSKIVNQLQAIAVQLRAHRMEKGCLKINQPKLSFTLDPNTGEPTKYSLYQLRAANQMIEDFMLLANASVAEFTHSKFPSTSILRSHYPPQDQQMKSLKNLLAKHGHNLQIDSSKAIADSFETISNSCPDPDAARAVLNIMIAKPMKRAHYFCSDTVSSLEQLEHFALAIPIYTHFTSPIRRYADCLVHRVLGAGLEVDVNPERTPEELSQLTEICNIKKYNAKLAGEASSLLYFKRYLKQVETIDTEAAVLSIGELKMEFVLIETGHIIKATYKELSKSAEFKIINDTKPIQRCTLISKEGLPPTTLQLFSKVGVTIKLVNDSLAIRRVVPLVAEKPFTEVPNDGDITSSQASNVGSNNG